MSTRHRTVSASRQDAYGLWRPSDSDSDRPRQTMATTQRHNVDHPAATESARKHRSSRRADPLDPAHSHHKSSSKDRTSATPQSYHTVPQSPQPSTTSRTHDVYSDAYGLRAYLKKKTDKRSPRSSNEKVPAPDDTQTSRAVYPSRAEYTTPATYAQPTAAAYAQPPTSTSYYTAPPDQTTRDPETSSRHHRDRDRDREKSNRRDAEKVSMRDYASERSEDRERRRRREKEAGKERERSSKDRDRHKEKDRSRHRERTAPDATSLNQAYTQAPAPAQRSSDRLPAGYSDQSRLQQAQAVQVAAPTTATVLPWSGLTATGRAAPPSNHVVDAGYPSASDREDPPLPIPPPGHRRERSSSKARGSQRHQVLAQQAAQDSGISSSEQEHSIMERTRMTDRRILSREQASTLGRGQSSGPSGSENEKPSTFQKERRKHKESSRHKSKTAAIEGEPPGPTTSQEIATAWYQRLRETTGAKQSAAVADSPQRAPTMFPNDITSTQPGVPYAGKPTSHVGQVISQRPTPQIVSIRAAQGPSEPHAGTLLPKNHSATSVHRQVDGQALDRAHDTASRSQPSAQYYQQSAGRYQDTTPQTAAGQAYTSTHVDGSRAYQHSSVNPGVNGSYQQSGQGYLNPVSHTRHAESNGVPSSAAHGGQQAALPDVVVRPPSAAPTQQDPYSSRTTVGTSLHHSGAVSGQRLQAPSHESRARPTPAPPNVTNHPHSSFPATQQTSHSHSHPSAQHPDSDPYRSAAGNANGSQQYGASDPTRNAGSTPYASAHPRDPSSRFSVYEDAASNPAPVGYGSQHTAVAYNTPGQSATPRTIASTIQAYPSASPKRNLTYPGASAPPPAPSVHVNPSNYHDARSPKPPSVATITPDTAGSRPQGHGREASGQGAHHQPSPRYDQSAAQLAADAGHAYAAGSNSGHSPSRHYLADPGRSPAGGHAGFAGSAAGTPKHSPSSRLHSHRNGSNDTITHAAPTKPSPASTFQQQLPHRNSVINLQTHAASRPDNASATRQPNAASGYPEPARYRSPAPPGYPKFDSLRLSVRPQHRYPAPFRSARRLRAALSRAPSFGSPHYHHNANPQSAHPAARGSVARTDREAPATCGRLVAHREGSCSFAVRSSTAHSAPDVPCPRPESYYGSLPAGPLAHRV
ncbi:hypothetical protein C2E23DRAFT_369348 [Lenzites betulinus]|nr:hypothetical protein C2E23DRAFT_369348 [Lenzites betulinus]